jgi:hypothetical protein
MYLQRTAMFSIDTAPKDGTRILLKYTIMHYGRPSKAQLDALGVKGEQRRMLAHQASWHEGGTCWAEFFWDKDYEYTGENFEQLYGGWREWAGNPHTKSSNVTSRPLGWLPLPEDAEPDPLLKDAWGALNFILAFYEPGQTYLDTEAWKVAEARARHVKSELAQRLGVKEGMFLALDYLALDTLIKAAGESTWIPKEYMMNDWVSDASEFLRAGKGINDHHLLNLLAVIHRDGGHYTEEHGLEKSVKDAMQLSSERIVVCDQKKPS